jgi:hypothetical protein
MGNVPARVRRALNQMSSGLDSELVQAFQDRGLDTDQARMMACVTNPDTRQELDRQFLGNWSGSVAELARIGSDGVGEVIIGGGLHGAIYAQARRSLGYPKPLVVESSHTPGGAFAVSGNPSFWLNSRNRPGKGGLPGTKAALNVFPGGWMQPSMLSGSEFQHNADMAFCVRMALAGSANVMPGQTVDQIRVGKDGWRYQVMTRDGFLLNTNRIIDARGLGTPKRAPLSEFVITGSEFMKAMDGRFPLRGMKSVAVVGAGDSGKCAIEALCGQGPTQPFSVASLDWVENIDWYGPTSRTCDDWVAVQRGRYRAIGSLLKGKANDSPAGRVRVREAKGEITGGFDSAFVNGRPYDLVINCTGFESRNKIDTDDLPTQIAKGVFLENKTQIAKELGLGIYQVGAIAPPEWLQQEVSDGLSRQGENRVSMWRLGPRTAALARRLGRSKRGFADEGRGLSSKVKPLPARTAQPESRIDPAKDLRRW